MGPVNDLDRQSAMRLRSALTFGSVEPASVRAALLGVAPADRDAWVDLALGLDGLPDDGPALPRGCTPYLPCSVDALLRVIDLVPVRASDVFVDLGAGIGRASALVHLVTGAAAVSVEVQPQLVAVARALTARLPSARIASVEGDAAELAGDLPGTVFFLYCPFGGERLDQVLDALERVARSRTIRVCCVDLPLPPRAWLRLATTSQGDVTIYRSLLA